MKSPPKALLSGRRALDGITELSILQDLEWSEKLKVWIIKVRFDIGETHNELVPSQTDWFAIIEDNYPWGKIYFFPSVKDGLSATFPHQMNNSIITNFGWRLGYPCLDNSEYVLRAWGYDSEPLTASSRLAWRARRAIMWTQDASNGVLQKNGDSFELPHFPTFLPKPLLVAYSENETSLQQWSRVDKTCGYARLIQLSDESDIYVIDEFQALNGNGLFKPDFGSAITGSPKAGIWIKLPKAPIGKVWEAPTTWGGLINVCNEMGVDFIGNVSKSLSRFRNGSRNNVMLVGFPVPKEVGGEGGQLHWQAIRLPQLTKPSGRGQRHPEIDYWNTDRSTVLKNENRIDWQNSENWDVSSITGRGALPLSLSQKRIVLIGAGAFGCLVSELLVRGGTTNLVLIDDDVLSIGNLCRHSLGIENLLKPKASELAARLNRCSPNAKVRSFPQSFPNLSPDAKNAIDECDLLIDCTGSDELITRLSKICFAKSKLFASFSVGATAKRLFCFSAIGIHFPSEKFFSAIDPWLEIDRTEFPPADFPREGIGCWHTVFPALGCDMMMMAGIAVKQLSANSQVLTSECRLDVFEQFEEQGCLAGIRRLAPQEK